MPFFPFFNNNTDFNPLRREGGDSVEYLNAYLLQIFQSTPPRGRRQYSRLLLAHGKHDFNPLRREGGDAKHWSSTSISVDFNPLRREGGDYELGLVTSMDDISIHSAARAETLFGGTARQKGNISIHSAARAETAILDCHVCIDAHFNPLRREGGDNLIFCSYMQHRDFNPLRREGGDRFLNFCGNINLQFQSTPPRGRRRKQ